ncbi:hypothetical protein Dcar01_03801 [Deinococcus carri]|uniref:YtxH domain-containing protein n=1 Tax=Deinococcus carri TaxID=1211323 RepID=A0ABP9WCH7_9DEIO
MKNLEQTAHDLKHAAHDAREHLQHEVAAFAGKAEVKRQAELAATVARQQKELHRLEAQVERLSQRSASGGGFPWGLVLLAGGVYALYRSNPSFRDQVQGLLRRVNPGVEGNLARAGDAAKDAVSKVAQGENPGDAMRTAGGELRRAGEKTVDQAQDRLHDLKNQAQDRAQDLKRDVNRAVDNARDELGRS